jgi:hypothetical protein
VVRPHPSFRPFHPPLLHRHQLPFLFYPGGSDDDDDDDDDTDDETSIEVDTFAWSCSNLILLILVCVSRERLHTCRHCHPGTSVRINAKNRETSAYRYSISLGPFAHPGDAVETFLRHSIVAGFIAVSAFLLSV